MQKPHALDDFEAGTAPPSDKEEALADQITEFRAMLTEMPMSARNRRTGISLIARLQKARSKETAQGGRRHRLLRRYWREARAQRKLQAWLACLEAQEPAVTAPGKTYEIPKQSQISS